MSVINAEAAATRAGKTARADAAADDAAAPGDRVARLLDVIAAVAADLRPGQPRPQVTLDTALEADLGLDSLARVELASRIENAFGTPLPDALLTSAERARDLLDAVRRRLAEDLPAEDLPAAATVDGSTAVASSEPGGASAAPAEAATLIDVLAWHARRHPSRLHLRLYAEQGEGEAVTYAALDEEARAIAAGLQALGVLPGDPVAIMLPTGRAYFAAFCGVLLAGAVAVPIYPPVREARLEEHLSRQVHILENAGATVLIVPQDGVAMARLLRTQVIGLRDVTSVEALREKAGRLQHPAVVADAPALLQYTSGSTGAPKGVTLSHANLIANIRAMAASLVVTPDDVFVSWLPLYHDMGLIGAWLGALHQGAPLVIMSPLAFLSRPVRWLQALHRFRGSISGGPNFAYELLLRHVRDEQLKTLDLSCWRVAFNGAEPVSAATLERFCARFAGAGFRREAMLPVYGLAENCVGLAFPPLGRGPVVDRVDRDALDRRGCAVPVVADDAGAAVSVVACGQPLPGHDIRVVDGGGFELADRCEGRLQFRGPSATRGYWRNEKATAALLHGDWRDSGDLAYVVDGEVYVTARAKDLIIRAGRNIHPADLEQAVGGIEGVLPGRVAAFGDADPDTGTERLIVVAETRRREPDTLAGLRSKINAVVAELAASPPDAVALLPPNAIPRTSSGKVRRGSARDQWRSGKLGAAPDSSRWLSSIRLITGTAAGQIRRLLHTARGLGFAVRAWLAFGLCAPFAWAGVLALPRASWRWRVIHRASRLGFRVAGVPLVVRDLANLPGAPCVVVANHASYLDVVALVAALPRPVAFVTKAELQQAWYTRLPLRRIGACFVERFDRKRGLEDYRQIAAAAREGRSPLFFPEGTFRRPPGLLPFRMGAFACAADAGLPVVPVVLRGTRQVLRSGSWFPRRGAVTIEVAAVLEPDRTHDRWAGAVSLRERARGAILQRLGEPDAGEADPFRGTVG